MPAYLNENKGIFYRGDHRPIRVFNNGSFVCGSDNEKTVSSGDISITSEYKTTLNNVTVCGTDISTDDFTKKYIGYGSILYQNIGNVETDIKRIDLSQRFPNIQNGLCKIGNVCDELIIGKYKRKNLLDTSYQPAGVLFGSDFSEEDHVLAIPLKAGKTYRMSYVKETTSPFQTWIYLGVSKNGIGYTIGAVHTSNILDVNYVTKNGIDFNRYIITLSTTASGNTINQRIITVTSDCYLIIYAANSTKNITNFVNRFDGLMVEESSDITEYEPYFSGDGILNGIEVKKRIGFISSYNGEDVGDTWVSSTGELTTGASVYYVLSKMEIYEDHISPEASALSNLVQFYGTNTISISASESVPSSISVTYSKSK